MDNFQNEEIIPIDLRYESFLKLARTYIEEQYMFKIKNKSEFCRKYKISRVTLNKYLDIVYSSL